MKRMFVLVLLLITVGLLSAVVWEIKQDGTGDFTTISEGINIAQNYDEIVVYPGVYYESINYQGKEITITSLYNETEDNKEIISETVIAGYQGGTTVTFENGETRSAVLRGFTLNNNYDKAYHYSNTLSGGGIYINEASPSIIDCVIENNRASGGGGIYVDMNANPFIRSSIVRNNVVAHTGGGIFIGLNSTVTFCDRKLNSIYLNYATVGSDIAIGTYASQPDIILDTFTVLEPDRFYITVNRNHNPDFTLKANKGKVEPVAADLYVSPDGNDANNGLSTEEPLQTIAMAMILIKPEKDTIHTIHVAEGLYSRSENNQIFPVQLREYTNLVGANKESVILDAERENSHLVIRHVDWEGSYMSNFSVKNLTLINGGDMNSFYSFVSGSIKMQGCTEYLIENISIYDCHAYGQSVFAAGGAGSYVIKNIDMSNVIGYNQAFAVTHGRDMFNMYLENIRIREAKPGPHDPPHYSGGSGRAFAVITGFPSPDSRGVIVNFEVTGCELDVNNIDPPWRALPSGSVAISSDNIKLINATIANNNYNGFCGGGLTIHETGSLRIYNSIIYGNNPHNLALEKRKSLNDPSLRDVRIFNSLIAQEHMFIPNDPNTYLFWDDSNIDADPLWVGDSNLEEYPYMLQEGSPAINKGTLDIPDFEFPEFDLAGNPRIVNGMIDMGAYEYQGVTSVDGEALPNIEAFDYKLYNYPNPISLNENASGTERSMPGTTISFQLPKSSQAIIDIYNVKGQFVKRLINAELSKGEYSIFWNGKDEQERLVGSGLYMYQLSVDDVIVSSGRCTVIK
ncbi:MAG: choice-of-anchor Q domain-containing protein [Sphaerochaetaceae bacterium]